MLTKSDEHSKDTVCSPGVLAPSTLSGWISPVKTPISPTQRRGLPSPISDSLGTHSAKCNQKQSAMRLTARDCKIIKLVFKARALRHDQIHLALFSPGAFSRCQRRLTLLVRHRYLDRLPRKTVNDPAVYILSRRSVEGNRLLRESVGDDEFRRRLHRLGSIDHLLAVNEVRVRVERACQNLGWLLKLWQGPEDLTLKLGKGYPLPDAYFQIQRKVDGTERTSAFFLELERAAKSSQVLRSKLKRYGELYYSGSYAQLFGTKALRVLFVLCSSDKTPTTRRVENGVEEAKRMGVTIARFAGLEGIVDLSPVACLIEPVWYAPSQADGRSALLAVDS